MIYSLYRTGYFIANALPLRAGYAIATFLGRTQANIAKKEREAVKSNLKVIFGEKMDEDVLNAISKEVFVNFAKYLVDFFRFPKVDEAYIKKNVRTDNLKHVESALSKGKGVILLSAHIGNWELGGAAMSLLGYPISAVALTHQNKKINDFFKKQRMLRSVTPIEIGISLRSCYRVLKHNGLLALLGDRDFMGNGLRMRLFDKEAMIPQGPAVFASRLGCALVPTFMIREKDDTFKLQFFPPIYPEESLDEDSSIRILTQKYLDVLQRVIKEHPTQWHVFRKVWDNGKEDLRPYTIV